eukprot:TRINITY_DN62839_c0_g1_i1.p1 TRINITY_DN62839_c0_g1~~TRINITY_DN62839_c0_g1_i1.p1  ORF type:complete len:1079 (+),score=270.93 TRINITY_DN62839_c0_g1_i1:84-3320(+)
MPPKAPPRCHMCRAPMDKAQADSHKKPTCEICEPLLRAPRCLACGERVRDAKRKEAEPYHVGCRRCSSCFQVVPPNSVRKLAGKIVCISCSQLFGKFFAPSRRSEAEHMREAFQAWDEDGNGTIEKSELKRVLQALDPDLSLKQLDKLMQAIDKNGNGMVEIEEFCDWINSPDPLAAMNAEDNFEKFVAEKMQEAGRALQQFKMDIVEVHVRTDGIYFVLENGDQRLESSAIRCKELELVIIDPEAFITRLEFHEKGLIMTMNTGEKKTVVCEGTPFGPYQAPEGFHIVGLRTKPAENDKPERIVGVDLAPLEQAKSYWPAAALSYAAESEICLVLRELMSKSVLDLNAFDEGGMTALMKAAQNGSNGALRMLLQSKANPNLSDPDGWTALTYASKAGQQTAVNQLIAKGATTDGDNGAALSKALVSKHNGAARALLRAGFGPASAGTFGVEERPDPAKCALQPPIVTPAGGAFSAPVSVSFSLPDDAPKGTKIKYTTDGRDPYLVGKVAYGPIKISRADTHLRVVAEGTGKRRSVPVAYDFTVCHFVLPDEVVSGALKVQIFKEAEKDVSGSLATALNLPADRITIKCQDGSADGDNVWVRAVLHDPAPQHLITIHRTQGVVKGSAKQKKFLDKFVKDITKGVGTKPEGIKLQLDNASQIGVAFTLPRKEATAIADHFANGGYLENKALLRTYFVDADIASVDTLGEQLQKEDVTTSISQALSKKFTIEKVVCVGELDDGVIGLLVPSSQAKKIQKPFETAIKKAVQKVTVSGFEVGPEDMDVEYMVDVLANPNDTDAGTLVRNLNAAPFLEEFRAELDKARVPSEVTVKQKSSSMELSSIQMRLEWEVPAESRGSDKSYLDCMCMAYAGSQLAQVIDFRSAINDEHNVFDGESSVKSIKLCRAVTRAIRHSGDESTEQGGSQKIDVDLFAVPSDVTDIYFVLAAYEDGDLSNFVRPSVEIHDAHTNRKLSEYELSSAGTSKAIVMCSLSRPEGKWLIQGVGLPTAGSVNDYDPIRRAIADRQVDYDRWSRRKDLIMLRVLCKLKRASLNASSQFAQFCDKVMTFPTPVFQKVINFV